MSAVIVGAIPPGGGSKIALVVCVGPDPNPGSDTHEWGPGEGQGGEVVARSIMFAGVICRAKARWGWLSWRGRGGEGGCGSAVQRLIKLKTQLGQLNQLGEVSG